MQSSRKSLGGPSRSDTGIVRKNTVHQNASSATVKGLSKSSSVLNRACRERSPARAASTSHVRPLTQPSLPRIPSRSHERIVSRTPSKTRDKSAPRLPQPPAKTRRSYLRFFQIPRKVRRPPPKGNESDRNLPPKPGKSSGSGRPLPKVSESDRSIPPKAAKSVGSCRLLPKGSESDRNLPPKAAKSVGSGRLLTRVSESVRSIPPKAAKSVGSGRPLPKVSESDRSIPPKAAKSVGSGRPLPKVSESDRSIPPKAATSVGSSRLLPKRSNGNLPPKPSKSTGSSLRLLPKGSESYRNVSRPLSKRVSGLSVSVLPPKGKVSDRFLPRLPFRTRDSEHNFARIPVNKIGESERSLPRLPSRNRDSDRNVARPGTRGKSSDKNVPRPTIQSRPATKPKTVECRPPLKTEEKRPLPPASTSGAPGTRVVKKKSSLVQKIAGIPSLTSPKIFSQLSLKKLSSFAFKKKAAPKKTTSILKDKQRPQSGGSAPSDNRLDEATQSSGPWTESVGTSTKPSHDSLKQKPQTEQPVSSAEGLVGEGMAPLKLTSDQNGSRVSKHFGGRRLEPAYQHDDVFSVESFAACPENSATRREECFCYPEELEEERSRRESVCSGESSIKPKEDCEEEPKEESACSPAMPVGEPTCPPEDALVPPKDSVCSPDISVGQVDPCSSPEICSNPSPPNEVHDKASRTSCPEEAPENKKLSQDGSSQESQPEEVALKRSQSQMDSSRKSAPLRSLPKKGSSALKLTTSECICIPVYQRPEDVQSQDISSEGSKSLPRTVTRTKSAITSGSMNKSSTDDLCSNKPASAHHGQDNLHPRGVQSLSDLEAVREALEKKSKGVNICPPEVPSLAENRRGESPSKASVPSGTLRTSKSCTGASDVQEPVEAPVKSRCSDTGESLTAVSFGRVSKPPDLTSYPEEGSRGPQSPTESVDSAGSSDARLDNLEEAATPKDDVPPEKIPATKSESTDSTVPPPDASNLSSDDSNEKEQPAGEVLEEEQPSVVLHPNQIVCEEKPTKEKPFSETKQLKDETKTKDGDMSESGTYCIPKMQKSIREVTANKLAAGADECKPPAPGEESRNPRKSSPLFREERQSPGKTSPPSGGERQNPEKLSPPSGEERQNPRKSSPPSGEERQNTRKSSPPSGEERQNNEKSSPLSREERQNPGKTSPPSGEERQNPEKLSPPSGEERQNPRKSSPPSGEERQNPRKSSPLSGEERQNPRKSSPLSREERRNPGETSPPSGEERQNHEKSSPLSREERQNPIKTSPPSGEERQNPEKLSPPSGEERQNPKKSSPPSGEERQIPRKSSLPSGEERQNPRKSSPPFGKERQTPRKSSPPSGEERQNPEKLSPPSGEERQNPRKSSPPSEEKRQNPRKSSPLSGEERQNPRKSPPPSGEEHQHPCKSSPLGEESRKLSLPKEPSKKARNKDEKRPKGPTAKSTLLSENIGTDRVVCLPQRRGTTESNDSATRLAEQAEALRAEEGTAARCEPITKLKLKKQCKEPTQSDLRDIQEDIRIWKDFLATVEILPAELVGLNRYAGCLERLRSLQQMNQVPVCANSSDRAPDLADRPLRRTSNNGLCSLNEIKGGMDEAVRVLESEYGQVESALRKHSAVLAELVSVLQSRMSGPDSDQDAAAVRDVKDGIHYLKALITENETLTMQLAAERAKQQVLRQVQVTNDVVDESISATEDKLHRTNSLFKMQMKRLQYELSRLTEAHNIELKAGTILVEQAEADVVNDLEAFHSLQESNERLHELLSSKRFVSGQRIFKRASRGSFLSEEVITGSYCAIRRDQLEYRVVISDRVQRNVELSNDEIEYLHALGRRMCDQISETNEEIRKSEFAWLQLRKERDELTKELYPDLERLQKIQDVAKEKLDLESKLRKENALFRHQLEEFQKDLLEVETELMSGAITRRTEATKNKVVELETLYESAKLHNAKLREECDSKHLTISRHDSLASLSIDEEEFQRQISEKIQRMELRIQADMDRRLLRPKRYVLEAPGKAKVSFRGQRNVIRAPKNVAEWRRKREAPQGATDPPKQQPKDAQELRRAILAKLAEEKERAKEQLLRYEAHQARHTADGTSEPNAQELNELLGRLGRFLNQTRAQEPSPTRAPSNEATSSLHGGEFGETLMHLIVQLDQLQSALTGDDSRRRTVRPQTLASERHRELLERLPNASKRGSVSSNVNRQNNGNNS